MIYTEKTELPPEPQGFTVVYHNREPALAEKRLYKAVKALADDYERLAFPDDDPIVRRRRERLLKRVRELLAKGDRE